MVLRVAAALISQPTQIVSTTRLMAGTWAELAAARSCNAAVAAISSRTDLAQPASVVSPAAKVSRQCRRQSWPVSTQCAEAWASSGYFAPSVSPAGVA